MNARPRLASICLFLNLLVICAMAICFAVLPAAIIVCNLRDPGLWRDQTPRIAFSLHRTITPAFEAWAKTRVASGRAATVSISNISGTEWPVFGSVFYLWATEALQDAWEQDPSQSGKPPKEYALGAIEAATGLVLDPNHASWVKQHWGADYMSHENLFYRYALIAAMTSHYRLTGDATHLPLLRTLVDALASEIDASEFGLLDDYPGQCFPADVMAAIACIRHTDRFLGTDHSPFAARALRAFEGKAAGKYGLPPYMADRLAGRPCDPSRGSSNSYIGNLAPQLWPGPAREWYAAYTNNFWQYRWFAWGFREFPKDREDKNWHVDVDAGPCISGHGIAASAFGAGAARANGRFDHAYPLTTEILAASWPLPTGRLLVPRVLSNAADAPLLGEVCILFNLTRRTHEDFPVEAASALPPIVYIMIAAYVGVGALALYAGLRSFLAMRSLEFPAPMLQTGAWAMFVAAGTCLLALQHYRAGFIVFLLSQFLPRQWPWLTALSSRFRTGQTSNT